MNWISYFRRWLGSSEASEGRSNEADPTSKIVDIVTEFVEQSIGPIDWVFHEIVSDELHIDLYFVSKPFGSDFQVVVTGGMSAARMTVPNKDSKYEYAELMIVLPSEWPVNQETWMQKPHTYLPLEILKALARYPHQYKTFLTADHTVQWDFEMTEGLADSEMKGIFLTPHCLPDKGFSLLSFKGHRKQHVNIWQLMPISAQELKFKLEHGADALVALFEKNGVYPVFDIYRESVI